MIDCIFFNQNHRAFIGLENNYIDSLQRINVFAGKNNSGKSRTLRYTFQLSSLHKATEVKHDLNLNIVLTMRRDFQHALQGFVSRAKRQINPNYKHLKRLEHLVNELRHVSTTEAYFHLKTVLQLYRIIADKLLALPSLSSQSQNAINEIEILYSEIWHAISEEKKDFVYIPILRGLRPVATHDQKTFNNLNLYKLRTVQDYGLNENFDIFTGLSLFTDVRNLLLGDHFQRGIIKEFESFLETELFQAPVTLIPREGKDTIFIKLGEEEEKAVYDYGDGMQTLITILFPIFLKKDRETLIFIEEPETHLHPQYQKKLLGLLKHEAFNKIQFFLTSHSAFIINDPEVKVYHFSKTNETFSFQEITSVRSKIQLMDDLGISPSDLLLANFVLFVEGPSDKVYFEYLLKKYHNLDIRKHYNIFLMNGDNYRHLFLEDNSFHEIMQLNRNIAIVLDGDRSKKGENYSPDKTKLKKLAAENEIMCWITQKREIENYIPFDVYKEAVTTINPDRLKIKWDAGDFANRTSLYEEKKSTQVSPKVTLSGNLLSKINATKTQSLDGISDQELRKAINAALIPKQEKFGVGKMNLAKKVVSMEPQFEDSELMSVLRDLAERIQNANFYD